MKNSLFYLFSNLKNNQITKKTVIFTKEKNYENLLKLLWNEGFILGYKKNKNKLLKIYLKYSKNKPVINSLNFISKPSCRVYYSAKKIWKINFGNNFLVIISTNKGFKTLNYCKKNNIGGELILVLN